jgi:hypothetical protein
MVSPYLKDFLRLLVTVSIAFTFVFVHTNFDARSRNFDRKLIMESSKFTLTSGYARRKLKLSLLTNGITPSTTSYLTLAEFNRALLAASNQVDMRANLNALSSVHDCVSNDCVENVTSIPFVRSIVDSVGGRLLGKDSSLQESIYNPHNTSFNDMMDLCFIFDRSVTSHREINNIFHTWHPEATEFHSIVLFEDPALLDGYLFPAWMTDFEVYVAADLLAIIKEIKIPWYIDEENTFIERFLQGSSWNLGLRNLVSWVADRELIFIVDAYTVLPLTSVETSQQQSKSQRSSGGAGSLLHHHIKNLRTPTLINYFNTVPDPFVNNPQGSHVVGPWDCTITYRYIRQISAVVLNQNCHGLLFCHIDVYNISKTNP